MDDCTEKWSASSKDDDEGLFWNSIVPAWLTVSAKDCGRPIRSEMTTTTRPAVGSSASKRTSHIYGSSLSVLDDQKGLTNDAEMVTTGNASNVEIMGVSSQGNQGIQEGAIMEEASHVDGTEEMEGLTVGVFHEGLIVGLANLNTVSSVFIGQTSTK